MVKETRGRKRKYQWQHLEVDMVVEFTGIKSRNTIIRSFDYWRKKTGNLDRKIRTWTEGEKVVACRVK